jgi:hypothetical protein
MLIKYIYVLSLIIIRGMTMSIDEWLINNRELTIIEMIRYRILKFLEETSKIPESSLDEYYAIKRKMEKKQVDLIN